MYYFKKRNDKNSIVPKDNDVTLIIKKLRNYLSIKKPFFFFFSKKSFQTMHVHSNKSIH